MQSRTLNITNKNGVEYITFPKLCECGAVRHVFSTRLGGVSTGRYSTMNMSYNNGDNFENVTENYRRLCGTVDIDPAHLVLSRQTHTSNVKYVDESNCGTGITLPPFSDVDGLITDRPGVALVTQYADCTPLLFCDPIKKVIANSHSGWRGTVKQIGKVTVDKMVKEFSCRPQDIIAAIGPCIGQCCYEVDDPVYNGFKEIDCLDTEKFLFSKENGRYMLDLAEANRLILINAGILPENIDVSDICTCCNSKELHSHRATNGQRGNLAAIIELI